MNAKHGLRIGVLANLCLFSAIGATFTEIGDAGQLPGTAQSVNTMPSGTALTAIQGELGSTEADVYALFLTGGQTFFATTNASSLAFNAFDTQLFLFNSAGVGVYANDDDPSSPPQSTLAGGITLTPAASGLFYLGISGSGFLPTSVGGFIFPVSGGILDQSGAGPEGNVGPTGSGGGSPLTGWSSVSNAFGKYEIQLSGAEFVSGGAAVPEPSSFLLIAAGCGLLQLRRLRRA